MFKNYDIYNLISTHIFHSLLSIYNKHPEWLNSEYKSYPWQEDNFAQKFIHKLSNKLPKDATKKEIYSYVVTFFSRIVNAQFFKSIEWLELVANLDNLWVSSIEIQIQPQYISLLLLDVENIKLSREIEHIFTEICEYPLLMKLAFGNWKKLGQKDSNLHERNYQLIHVPQGKNNADFKIIEIGKFLINQDINIKEVFVVSSDTDLDCFGDFLREKKLTLYRVTRNVDILSIFNSKTQKTNYYSLNTMNEMPSLPDFINQLREIIKEEEILNGRRWIKVTRLYQLFHLKHKLNIDDIFNNYFPNKSNPWLEIKYDFAVHNLDNKKQIYLSIFDGKLSQKVTNQEQKQSLEDATIKPQNLSTPEDLEQAIYQIIEDLISESDQNFTTLSKVATKFNTQYKISLTKIIKKFNLTKKLTKLIESYPKIIMEKAANNYHIRFKSVTHRR